VPYGADHFLERFFSVIGLNTQHFESLNISKNASLSASQIKQLQEYDELKGDRGDLASKHRNVRDNAEILAVSCRKSGSIAVSAQTKRRLATLDLDYAAVLEQWRLLGLLAE
jgi:hypothetical protein